VFAALECSALLHCDSGCAKGTVVEKGVFEKRENDGIKSSDIRLTCWICFPTVKKRSK
jgi:hypothetical protein